MTRTASPKVLGIAWIAFAAMSLGGLAGYFETSGGKETGTAYATRLVWGYGLSSGAMVVSASVFLIPPAIRMDAAFGGIGVAVGFVSGFVVHILGHTTKHVETDFLESLGSLKNYTVAALTAHSVAAGLIIGVIYSSLPSLGPLLGLGIVSHKAPAGYAAVRRLSDTELSPTVLLIPASGVGVAALVSNSVRLPTTPGTNALVFGFGAGVFLHLATDFLPRCETGGEVDQV
ncbi:MAG: ZIP family metal transporter, partial [Halobacteria archaeon]|nr:ZIP family metal transporter [Halobacteria archaeon]